MRSRSTGIFVAASVLAACLGASAPSPAPTATTVAPALTIAGVTVGGPVLPLVKKFGVPDLVQTEDDGHFWQWSRAGGLDREIITDDDLDVQSVRVARADAGAASPSPAPSEIPLLGLDEAGAASAAATLGATDVRRYTGPTLVWHFDGALLVAEFADAKVVKLSGIDIGFARTLGYFGASPSPQPAHHAPVLLREIIPQYVPPGSGTAIVRVDLDANGKVKGTRIVLSSGDVGVDAFVQESMRLSTFAPALCAGAPCPGTYLYSDALSHFH